jgi:hypothetical protein
MLASQFDQDFRMLATVKPIRREALVGKFAVKTLVGGVLLRVCS